jgi:hypothetical protein
MKDKDGQVITVNENDIGKYEQQGYTTDLKKALDQSKLSDNSVFKTSNKSLIPNDYDMPNKAIGIKDAIANNGYPTTTTTKTMSVQPKTAQTKTTQTTPKAPAVNPLVTALKAKIQQQIDQRKQQTQPLRNQSEVQKAQDLRMILEKNANMGYGNPASRSNALQSQIAGENRLNAIDLQEQNDISNIETEGIVQQSQLEENALRRAIEDARYNDNLAYQRDRDEMADERFYDELDYNRSQDAQTQEESALNKLKQEFVSTINRFANNFQAKINEVRNDGDSSNDWQIALLESARQDKIAREGLDQQGNKLPTTPTQMSYSEALKLWESYGIATPEIAAMFNVPVGAKHTDYIQTQYDTGKPYYAPKSSGGGNSGGYGLDW